MSIFEAAMLICFGASWPVSLWVTCKTKTVKGRSVVFSWLILLGYICGMAHKIIYDFNNIIYLYVFIALLVIADIILWYRYKENDILTIKEQIAQEDLDVENNK